MVPTINNFQGNSIKYKFRKRKVIMYTKKIISIIICLSSVVMILTACSTDKRDTPKDVEKTPISTENDVKTPDATENVVTTPGTDESDVPVSDKEYELVSENYKVDNISINYPKITNLTNAELENKINELIKNEALKIVKYASGDGSNNTMDMNYEIKYKGDDSISIVYKGYVHILDAPYPVELFFTTNLDIINAKKINLSDMVSVNDKFVTLLKSKDAVLLNEEQKIEVEDILSNPSILTLLNNADSLDTIGEVNQSVVYSYFTEDAIGLSFSVRHVVGDHAELEIKKEIIGDVLN
jgi:hypothetical protein